jgi:hypothetical protein
MPLAQGFCFGCQTGDADQFRFGDGQEGKTGHEYIRLLFAYKVSLVIVVVKAGD